MKHDKFIVTGMTCSACSAHVEKSVSHVEGVSACSVNLLNGSMTVDYDEAATSPDKIVAAVVEGDTARSWPPPPAKTARRRPATGTSPG